MIVIEYVLIENFIINFFIFTCSAALLHEKIKLKVFASLVAAGLALVFPLFNLSWWASLIIKVFMGAGLVSLCFSFKNLKQFFVDYATFMGFTFLFGGGVFALQQVVGELSLLAIIGTCFAVFLVACGVIKYILKKRVVDNFRTSVKIIDGEKSIEETGYFDSGNLLYDPISSQPIVLITFDVFAKLYGEGAMGMFFKKFDEKSLKCGHYISAKCAAGGGKMLVFRVDKLLIGDKQLEFDRPFLGVSMSGFEKAMHSGVLLHSSQVEGL